MDAAKDTEAQESYFILINTSSTRANETEKSSYGLDWLQKAYDNKIPQNVQDIRRSHKLYWENYENLENGIDSRREKLSWNEDPERYIPERRAITTTICNSDDATEPHTQKMFRRIQTQ